MARRDGGNSDNGDDSSGSCGSRTKDVIGLYCMIEERCFRARDEVFWPYYAGFSIGDHVSVSQTAVVSNY